MIALLTLGRPLFLVGGVVMHLLGVAVALFSGAALNLPALFWGQIAITAIQWMTHYCNDYFDLQIDRLNRTPTNWSGGSRVLLSGSIPPRAALYMALGLAVIAVSAALFLALHLQTGALTLLLISAALGLAWFYSAPPLRLHSRGMGEAVAALLVAGLVPLTGYTLQTGRLDALPMLASLPLVCFQFCMLLAVEFPDAEGDHAAGKGTLVVRLGNQRATMLYGAALLTAYLLLPLLGLAGVPPLAGLAVGLTFPLGLVQLWRTWRGDTRQPERWNSFAFGSVALVIAAAAVEAFAFLLLIGI